MQITGRTNYERFSRLLKVDLLENPRLALDPKIAFQIMSLGMHKGYFTSKKLSDYINAKECDFVNARRIINRLDKADTIANYARRFYTILKNSLEVTAENIADVLEQNKIEPPVFVKTEQNNQTVPQLSANSLSDTQTAQSISDASTPENSGNNCEYQMPSDASNTQIAENITKEGAGDTPPNFAPETKEQLAPAKENSTANATKMTIFGIGVPASIGIAFKAVTDAISQGFVSAQDIGNFVLGLVQNNLKYVLILIGLIIVGMMLKKAYKQITMWISMWINTDPNRHDIEVKPQ